MACSNLEIPQLYYLVIKDTLVGSRGHTRKSAHCSGQEKWKIKMYLIRMGLILIVGPRCFILM